MRDWLARAHPRTVFRRFPVTAGNELWLLYAKIYYGVRTLGMLNRTHEALFDAAHMGNLDTLDDATELFTEYGITETRFLESLTTVEVHDNMVEARAAAAAYRIQSVPALVVGGRYSLINDSFADQEELLACLDFLVQQELRRYRLALD